MYYRLRLILFILALILAMSLSAQNAFVATLDNKGQIQCTITIQRGHTLFGLAHASGSSISDLRRLNPTMTAVLNIGDRIILPIAQHKIAPLSQELFHAVALHLVVQQGNTLYHISRSVGTSVEILKHQNNLDDNSLNTGDTLKIGWINWPYRDDFLIVTNKPIDELSLGDFREGPLAEDSAAIVASENTSLIKINKVVTEKGIAYWERTNPSYHELIAMHPTARINSQISLYNPMLKTTVNAKVVGELPKEAYPDDVSVVISSSVANALGALDKRFLVEITYIE